MATKKRRPQRKKREPARPVHMTQAEVDEMIGGKVPPKSLVQRIRASTPSRAIGRLNAKYKQQPVAIKRAEMVSITRRGVSSKAVQAGQIASTASSNMAAKGRTKRNADVRKRPRKKPPAITSQ